MTEEQTTRFDDALERLAGDQELLVILAEIAAEDGPPMLNQLDQLAANGATAEYAKVAHALKGLLSTFETGEPVSELQTVIDSARSGDSRAVQLLHDKHVHQLRDLMQEITALGGH